MCSHINSAHVVMFEDVAVRRVAVNEVLHGVQNSRFCDVCAKFYMDTNYGRTWHAESNGCSGVSELLNQLEGNLGCLPPVAAALEVTRALPVELRDDGVHLLGGVELVRVECGSVFQESGRTHAQACFYMSAARSSAAGAAAVRALGEPPPPWV